MLCFLCVNVCMYCASIENCCHLQTNNKRLKIIERLRFTVVTSNIFFNHKLRMHENWTNKQKYEITKTISILAIDTTYKKTIKSCSRMPRVCVFVLHKKAAKLLNLKCSKIIIITITTIVTTNSTRTTKRLQPKLKSNSQKIHG